MTTTLKIGQVWIDLNGNRREIIAIENSSLIKYIYNSKIVDPAQLYAKSTLDFKEAIKNSRLETKLEKALRDLKSGE